MLGQTARISLFLLGVFFTGVFFFFVPDVFAQADSAAEVAGVAGLGGEELPVIIGRIIRVFLGVLGIIFLILFMYAGFLWMTAGGDDKKVEKAKRILIQATVGLVITLSAYGITMFVLNILGVGTGFGPGGGGGGGVVSVERLSGALGSGPLRDHYPSRNQTGVPRNARIMITFKEAIDLSTVSADTVKIYPSAEGESGAVTDLTVSGTPDGKTVVLKPTEYLGSATAKMEYTVFLSTDLRNASGDRIFSGSFSEGYEWSFETATTLDLLPPSVVTVTPSSSGAYARNVSVQVTFSEPVDPTSASGQRGAVTGFDNIAVVGGSGAPLPGMYEISNSYTSVTFTPENPCGTNSCGETIECLPGNEALEVTVRAATATVNPPQADLFPYNGVADMAGNALDGNDDGTAGDSYAWNFSTTGDIALQGPTLLSISPNIFEENVPLDQPITLTFDGVLKTSSVGQDTIELTNTELSSNTSHELWYVTRVSYLTANGDVISSASEVPAQTLITLPHGTFLQSVDGKSYVYGTTVTSGILNEYQNCYVPGLGPDASGGTCAVSAGEPYCCNGVPSATSCVLF